MKRLLLVLSVLVGIVVTLLVILFAVYAIGGGDHTGNAGYEQYLAWSPDGKKFAYVHFDNINGNCLSTIWVQDADSGQKVKLTDSGDTPAWSPDSKHIAFVLFQSQYRSGIAVMDADGSHVRPLLLRSSFSCVWSKLVDPNWSPDGRLIAFSTQTNADGGRGLGIFTIHPDGTSLRRLSTGNDYWPDWSPDSKHLVFTHREPGQFGRYSGVVVNTDGTARRTIQSSLSGDTGILPKYAWSPDGKAILGNYGLVPVNGGAVRPFPSGVWSPDGKRVATLTDGGKIVITDVPTVSRSLLRYHYNVRLAPPAETVTYVGDQVEVYVSSADLPQTAQAPFTLCAVRLHGERCFRDTSATPPSNRLTVTGRSETYFQWRINADEAADGDLRVSIRIDGHEVAHTTVTVRITH